ncbi:MAG: Putative transport system permease protein [uncultured Solirubrobacteraceae bacterium]|uniref:Transport system permease protein n=1 Tax=uncultured Solirubrobacteraceae bacterium TaxID=1162706 RepID=A0A6J4S0Z2_9ACTN|nr:MAG: Putative transport system permease protein [uncultured Solirubrobacteraceae bacterium]
MGDASPTLADLLGLSPEQRPWFYSALFMVIALLCAWAVDRGFSRRGRALAILMSGGDLSAEADTRLRFVRRLIVAAIVVFGIALALGQFDGFGRLATSLLASGAIAAAVLGFAARQTLANLVAGVMIAITQPVRVGDWVTFEDVYGEVDDVRLNYTYLRTPGNQRVIIPNEKLASGILRNDTLATRSIDLEVALWLPHTVDTDRAIAVLHSETGCQVTVAETRPEGLRLSVVGDPVSPPDRGRMEGELRTRCMSRLRADGLLPVAAPEGVAAATANQ